MTNFPTLFKKDKTGEIRQWQISVSKNVIYIEHGRVDGQKIKDTELIKSGKNTGKTNETTPEQQAHSEAESKWKKMLDKGYVESLTQVDEVKYLPMLAHKYNEKKHRIHYPAYVQPKLDGTRIFATIKNGQVILTTRLGKNYPHMEHLFNDIRNFPDIDNLILDGELYTDEMPFEVLVGLVKKKDLTEDDKMKISYIKFHIFDCVIKNDLDASFEKRYKYLTNIFDSYTSEHLIKVCSVLVNSEMEMEEKHKVFTSEGMEGTIIRNIDGKYELNKRSNNLQKYKHFLDDEFEIIGFTHGTGRAERSVIFICKNKDGREFNVRPKGSEWERNQWYDNGKSFIGKNITVRYQELSELGVPRFPVGIIKTGVIRDYE